jgi:hypothetical protein
LAISSENEAMLYGLAGEPQALPEPEPEPEEKPIFGFAAWTKAA